MFFDAHVHLGKKSFFKAKVIGQNLPVQINTLDNTSEKYGKEAEKKGIYKAVICPYPLIGLDVAEANCYIAESYAKNQELFIPFYLLDADLDLDKLESEELYGIKEHFYLDKDVDKDKLFTIYDCLLNQQKPLLIHPHLIERVEKIHWLKKNFPRLKIILAHSGRKWPFTGDDVLETVIPQLKHYDDIFFDTSSIRDSSVITDIVKIIGSERVLFGSDYPFSQSGEDVYDVEQQTVQQADLNELAKENIFFRNFKRMFLKDVWLRRTTKQDRGQVLALFGTLTAQEKKFLVLETKMEVIKSNIRAERHIYLLENSTGIVGYIRESGRSNRGTMIEEIIIKNEYRGKGYAAKLLNAIYCKFDYAELKTFADNISMNRLCEKLGFHVIKRSPAGSIYNWRKTNGDN